MSLNKSIFVTIVLLISITAFAQRGGSRGGDYNRLGLQAGYSIFDIITDDLQTESQSSFQGGFTTRGSYRNNFDLIYGINFISNNIGIKAGLPCGIIDCPQTQTLTYNIIGAQINLLASYNIIKHNLSVELGPMLMINGKMKLDDERFKDYIVEGYALTTAEEIQNINTINAAILAGITGGHENVRLNINYQYGLTNVLGGLNNQSLENTDFKGYTSTITVAGIIYF